MWPSTSSSSQLYQTPIKQTPITQSTPMNCSSPFQFDFNLYFGNLFSSGHLPVQQRIEPMSSTQAPKENNFFLFKPSFDRSYLKITPGSEYKIMTQNINKCIYGSTSTNESLTKKNLSSVFDNAKNDTFCLRTQNTSESKDNDDDIEKTFLFGSPKQNRKHKKMFECSGSTMFNSTNTKASFKKKRRFRKNNEQLKCLSVFYNENKHWSKLQIQKISEQTGLKENKVYKWLWDQKNKELKNAKFVVNK